jgi:hypothetical protein
VEKGATLAGVARIYAVFAQYLHVTCGQDITLVLNERTIPIRPAEDSDLGRLLTKLQAAEVAADAHRLVVTNCRDSYNAAELASRHGRECGSTLG